MQHRDQELRFTVRESPDYYQLKVSVFNDDKKTELIGETWISLDSILVPGGGRNDIWHNLNCKGKYAGELRVELTYYDTRPRENRAEEKGQTAPVDGMPGSGLGREVTAGPRQMKPTKRRPLPANPNVSLSQPQTPTQSLPGAPQRYVEGPDDYAFDSPPPLRNQLQHSVHTPSPGPMFNQSYNTNQSPYEETLDLDPRNQYPSPEQFGQHGPGINAYGQQNSMVLSQSPQNGNHDQPSPYQPSYELPSIPPSDRYVGGKQRFVTADPRENIDPQLLNEPQRLNMMHSNSSPAVADRTAYPRSPVSKQNSYDNNPTEQSPLRQSNGDAWPSADNGILHSDGPPPPPQHRHSGSRSALQSQGRDFYGSAPSTAPLNTQHDRGGSFSNSPLSQVQSSTSSAVSAMSTSPSNRQQYPHHGSISPMSSYHSPIHRRSQSPIRESVRDREVYSDSMPPSLTPGYDPSIAADESERLIREQRMIGQQTAQGSMPRYQQAASVPIQQPRAQPIPRGFESINNRREHREHRYSAPIPPTAPVGRSQPVNGDPRTPMRKSVSPQPASGTMDRRHSELPSQTPYGPDSFDVYNPTIGSASSVNDVGARYTTPEQAREATFQHEKQSKLGDGPIIGSDGRVIDPSDHLPSDTWAPEPEQKPSRKGPEVTVRFRHSPQGAQPMPQNVRQPLREARPNVVPSPTYAQSGENPPSLASRARLQKKSRPGMAQPNSSPLMQTLNASPRTTISRTSASDYPLRENEIVGSYGKSSPIYGNRSPGSLPPPIPGKVPIGSGQEDWGMSALSEEMRRIDIGVGGRNPPRRARYGTRDV